MGCHAGKNIGKALGGILGGLFGGGGGGGQRMEAPKLSGRDILQQTQSKAPEAPTLGDKPKRKKRGRKSLMVEKQNQGSGGGYNSLNI